MNVAIRNCKNHNLFLLSLTFVLQLLLFLKISAQDTEEQAEQKLKEIWSTKLNKLVSRHSIIEKSQQIKQNKKEISKEEVHMIVDCKNFMRQILSETGLEYWLKKFIQTKQAENENLVAVYDLTLRQHEILDAAMLESMYHEHKNNQPKTEKPLQKAVIVGAGPNGLYAALQLFLSGIKVTLVNDRKDYIRNQIVRLDANYMLQLRILLGTKFSELFEKDSSPGILTEKNRGFISLKDLEGALRHCLLRLQNYLQSQDGNNRNLEIFFQVAVDDIEFPTKENPHYLAVLKSFSSTTKVAFDILVCAAGTKSQFCNTYLGISKEYTIPKKYGITVLIKGEQYKNKKVLTQTYLQPMDEFLNKKQFIAYIESSLFLTQILRNNFVQFFENSVFLNDTEKVVEHETRLSIYLAIDLNLTLSELLDSVKTEKNKFLLMLAEKNRRVEDYSAYTQQFDDFASNIVTELLKAKAYQTINGARDKSQQIPINFEQGENKPSMLNFDPHPVNTSTFEVSLFALDKMAVEYNVMGHSAIIFAVGDSAANSHFYTGSGLRIGRNSVNNVVAAVKQYNSTDGGQLNTLVDEVNEHFERLKQQVRKLSKDVIEFRSKEDIDRIALNAMCLEVNKIKLQNTDVKHGFQIHKNGDLSPENTKFVIFIDRNVYTANITENAQIQIGNRSDLIFASLTQAAVSLKKSS